MENPIQNNSLHVLNNILKNVEHKKQKRKLNEFDEHLNEIQVRWPRGLFCVG